MLELLVIHILAAWVLFVGIGTPVVLSLYWLGVWE